MNMTTSSPRQPLRVGLLIDSFIQPKWVAKIIEDLKRSSFAEISLIIKNDSAEVARPSRWRSYWINRKYLLYAFYCKLDQRVSLLEDDAFEDTSINELISDASVVNVKPESKKYSDWFPPQDVATIATYNLDVAIAFGFRILRGDALRIAKHGVWSYHHGDNLVNRGGPACFWEVMDSSPTTGAVLQVLSEDLDNGKVICRSLARTSDKFSVKANRNNLYWKASAFILRKLKEVFETGRVDAQEEDVYRPYHNRLYKMPSNRELAPKLYRLSLSYARAKASDWFYFDQWSLAYRFKQRADDPNNTFYRFLHLVPPKDVFWADPFPVKWEGKYFVFFEEYLYQQEKAHISVMEVDRSGHTQPVVALKRDYHLSYPFVFEWNGGLYMIPETASNETIELYSCESFPNQWKLHSVLLEGIKGKDATLVELDGLWWMFVAVADTMISDELHAYYSESPLGPWEPHKRNPIKSDVRNSRPAGGFFTWKGALYRPAQDSSGGYGHGMTLNRLIRLTPEEFVEQETSKILPNWRPDLLGTHTLNLCDDLTVIDCLVRRRR